jgi:hypothetical protein
MRAVPFLVAICCLVLIGCGSSKPQDLIVGKWEEVAADIKPGEFTEEFTKDGRAIHRRGEKTIIDRKYTLADDGTLDYVFDDGKKATYKAKVTKDELTLTSGDNQVTKFKRMK